MGLVAMIMGFVQRADPIPFSIAPTTWIPEVQVQELFKHIPYATGFFILLDHSIVLLTPPDTNLAFIEEDAPKGWEAYVHTICELHV